MAPVTQTDPTQELGGPGAPIIAPQLQGHLDSGAKRVVLSTPALDEIDRTIVHGVNDGSLRADDRIVSCASSTTHALGLLIKILDEALGVERAMMTTVHAYSSDQKLAVVMV